MTSENRLIRLNQNGKEPGYIGFIHDITNEHSVPGLEIAPGGRVSVRRNDGVGGRGGSKKRMPDCNGLDKSSRFALTRKGADLLRVFHGKEWRYTCECT